MSTQTDKKIYFAPMEGVGGYIYRNAHHDIFGGIEKYFSPFIYAGQNGIESMKETKDVLPENNEGILLVPQLLANHAENFVKAAKFLHSLGYQEVNLNAGCPSKTVTTKHRGAGILLDLDEYDRFLYEVFEQDIDFDISIKTRTGYFKHEEFFELLEIYNKYPISELTIHPRTREELYNNHANLEIFEYAVKNSKNKLCYNGDIVSYQDFMKISERFPEVDAYMVGRGFLKNPLLSDEIQGIESGFDKVIHFLNRLLEDYSKVMRDEKTLVFKLKEEMLYLTWDMPGDIVKSVKKMKSVAEFKSVLNKMRSYYRTQK